MVEPHTPVLLKRLQAVHRALTLAGFDHAVGGAIALAVHVRDPRFTADMDLNVMADPAHPEPLLRCLPDQIEIHQGAATEIRRDGQTRLVWPDPRTPVDLFLPQHPEYHRLVTDRAVPVDFLGDGIKVLTATDLMVFKALFDRPKDWVDIDSLVDAGEGDVGEASRWVSEFVGADDARAIRLAALGEPA